MPTYDPRIDAYISKSADFAKPILEHIRKLVHTACPEVEETMKWSFPHFLYKGILCNMAAFKAHCSFGFWKGRLIFGEQQKEAMGHFRRITSLSDLPADKTLIGYIKEAVHLNEEGVKGPAKPKPTQRKTLEVPPELRRELKKDKKASETFENFSYSHKKEYVEWITEAKREETKAERVKKTIEWLTEGKSRHWKYQKC